METLDDSLLLRDRRQIGLAVRAFDRTAVNLLAAIPAFRGPELVDRPQDQGRDDHDGQDADDQLRGHGPPRAQQITPAGWCHAPVGAGPVRARARAVGSDWAG